MSTGNALDLPEQTPTHPRYDAYKDAGVEWLGEIPEHWQIMRLKFQSTFKGGGTPSKDNRDYWSGDIPWVSPKDMKVGAVTDTEDHITLQAVQESSTSLVAPGSVLVVVRSGILKHTIPVATNEVEVALNQDLKAITPDERLDPRYLAYLIRGKNDVLLLEWTKSGTTVESLEHDRIANTQTPIPPLPEQRAIAAYLDRETERIDALVEKKERLIELLEEKRTALISHAVTKGLDDDAEMKDSGVEWLGEIPAGWEVVRLKHIADVQGGIAKGKRYSDDEETVRLPYLRVANVQDGYLNLDEISEIEVTPKEAHRYALREGDVLMNEGGDYDKLGRGAVWSGEIAPCLHQNHVFAVRPDGVEPEWLAQVTRTTYAKHFFILRSVQSTNLASISMSSLKELPVVLPTEKERQHILQAVSRTASTLDTLIGKVRDGIDRLKEYRTALISAAVTGQIDVRG